MYQEQEIGAKNLLDLLSFPCVIFQISSAFVFHDLFLKRRSSPLCFCSLAGALMVGILQHQDTDSCVRMGLLAARLSLASPHPIAPTLTLDSVDPNKFQAEHWPKPSFMWIE